MSDELVLQLDPPYAGSAVSPTVDITETTTDVTVTITDFRGEHSYSVEKTDQAIADAEQAATNANAAAQYARDTADQAAADAQETADAAAGRADTAAASATQAAQAANTAAGTANTSAQNADAKAALADSKAALANQAATTANQAAQAAEAATTAANTAAGQATTAAGNATTAAGTANTAADNADAKAQLADTAATNADTATQAANTATTAATNAAQAANNAADYAIEAADDMPKLIATVDSIQTVTDAWPTTLESATLYGKSVQDGTPTPENPVPVQVVGGKNLLETTFAGSATSSGVTATKNNDGSITLSGTASGVGTWMLAGANPFTDTILTLAPGTYTLSLGGAFSQSCTLTLFDWPNSKTIAAINGTDAKKTFTLTEAANVTYVRFQAYSGTYDHTIYPQLEAGNHATPYTPYGCIGLQIGETVTPIDLQGNVLASLPDGTRDILTVDSVGHCVLEKRVGSVDLGNENWTRDPTGTFYAIEPLKKYGSLVIMCSVYQTLPSSFSFSRYSSYPDGLIAGNSGDVNQYFYVKDTRYTTAADLKAALSGVTVYFSLETPQTIELGAIEPPEMLQECEVAIYASLSPEWAIEYEQDPNAVITAMQASIAPVEGGTASANYAVNSYLIHANQLYRVISAIATGETITPGTNCVACTVMGEVIRLTA